MAAEWLKAVDEERMPIGVFTREDIHSRGLLHETFHCWIVQGKDVVVQVRSRQKKDFPGLADITAAGHLLADETVREGVRELEEELGIQVSFEQLAPIGIIKDEITLPNFIDREWTHVYAWEAAPGTVYTLQEEEVEAVDRFPIADLKRLWEGEEIRTRSGRHLKRADFVPHEDRYMEAVIDGLLAFAESKG